MNPFCNFLIQLNNLIFYRIYFELESLAAKNAFCANLLIGNLFRYQALTHKYLSVTWTLTHTSLHTLSLTHTQTGTLKLIWTFTHTYIQVQSHRVHKHTTIHPHIYRHIPTRIDTHKRTHAHTLSTVCTYTYTEILIDTHNYTHINTYTLVGRFWLKHPTSYLMQNNINRSIHHSIL